MKRVFIVFSNFDTGADMRVFTNYASARKAADAIIARKKSVGYRIEEEDRGNDINDYCLMDKNGEGGFCNVIQKELED